MAMTYKKFITSIINIFKIECPNCKEKAVAHSHSELIGSTTKEVYECGNCAAKFI